MVSNSSSGLYQTANHALATIHHFSNYNLARQKGGGGEVK